MNRKNLTAAVLAGLAGAAGIAGTAQAVNLNPDGLGQVLIYPYYTTNGGNSTILSVVNTTGSAKAVKVRFKEGFNSREVLDFNMYMSAYDVWAASISDVDGTPTLTINDTTCTVPYLYENPHGQQVFLDYAYTGDFEDGGPTDILRAAEGYFEMIEMGTLTGSSAVDATHVVDDDGVQAPADCQALVDAWTTYENGVGDGYWTDDETIDISRNSGGLFGGAAVINVLNGTMYSYNAQAVQGYDKSPEGNHFEPGDSHPSLDDGDQYSATVFFGVPQDKAVTLWYPRPVDAVSAVFMHEFTMNEYSIESSIGAASEWVMTFPTKNWYVDQVTIDEGDIHYYPGTTEPYDDDAPIQPFTEAWDYDDGEACEPFNMRIWDREENAGDGDNPSSPPVVSPKPPPGTPDNVENVICYEVNVLRFGNEDRPGVNFPHIFDTPDIDGHSLLKEVDTGSTEYDNATKTKWRQTGWARIDWYDGDNPKDPVDDWDAVDFAGLVGLPVTGFWAEEFQDEFVELGVRASYSGLFGHKGNVRRVSPHND